MKTEYQISRKGPKGRAGFLRRVFEEIVAPSEYGAFISELRYYSWGQED